ncbi:hypothetical protein Tco_0737588 [Tanacetum coccineum]
MVIDSPYYSVYEELASPEQTATDWKLLFFDVAASFDSAVHRVHAVSFDAAVASTVSAACCSSSVPADYVPAGHVIISADRYSEYADLSYRHYVDHNDDASPEGESSAKRHKTSAHETYIVGESSSEQVMDEPNPSGSGIQE